MEIVRKGAARQKIPAGKAIHHAVQRGVLLAAFGGGPFVHIGGQAVSQSEALKDVDFKHIFFIAVCPKRGIDTDGIRQARPHLQISAMKPHGFCGFQCIGAVPPGAVIGFEIPHGHKAVVYGDRLLVRDQLHLAAGAAVQFSVINAPFAFVQRIAVEFIAPYQLIAVRHALLLRQVFIG